MDLLYDETYASDDGKRTSRNIWYGNTDIYIDGEHGKSIRLDKALMDILCEKIENDFTKNTENVPIETNWYFFESAVLGENVSPTVMVRERAGEFVTNFNISDSDFAVNIDAILLFKADFEKNLASRLY